MFSEENLQPGASGPTILDLTMARTKTGLSYAKGWSADALTRICEVHGVHPGSVDDKETLIAMLEKSLAQPVVYEGFELHDLNKFIEARGLSPHQPSTNTIMTRSSSQDTSLLQQSAWQDKAALDGIGLSTKRNHESAILTERLLPDTRSFNTSTMLTTVLHGFKTVLNTFNNVSRLEDQSAMVVSELPSDHGQTKGTLIESLETADQNAYFNFLGLPAEIREQVYDLTCCASLPIFYPQRQPAITKASRLTRAEALPIYYKHNRFAAIVGALHEMSQHNSWMRCFQSINLSWIRSFAFVDLNHREVIELDIKPHGETRHHFKTRKLPGKKPTTPPSRNVLRNRRLRFRYGDILDRSRNVIDQFDNDGFALVLSMPNHHEDDYIEVESQLADRIQTAIDKEMFEANERRTRFGDGQSRMLLDRSSFFPNRLPPEDWELLQREWKLAQGFSVVGLRALTYALYSRAL